jgi:cyanophycinase
MSRPPVHRARPFRRRGVALVDHPRHSRLLVIGGGERSGPGGGEILRRFVDLAGGAAAELIVIATASAEPAVLEAEYTALFTRLGAGRVRALRLESRTQANEPSVDEVLATATGLGGTRTDSALQRLVRAGTIVLGGTSAGAAMMSGTMIIGGEGPGVTRAGVRTGPGLEFLPGVLIDMHFAERGRLNRLLSAVARYPHELGLGIDENTAILAEGDSFEVLGTGAVTVVDAGAAAEIRVPAAGPIALTGARVHVLPAGCRFELSGRRPSIVDGAAGERELAA